MSGAPALLVFAKEPLAGTVKTRLARSIGDDAALRVYQDLLATTLGHAHGAWRMGAVSHLELWCAGDADAPFLRGIATAFGARRHAQCGADLGARMAHAIDHALRRAPSVLVIGSDCPVLDGSRLAAASAALRAHECVIVPAEDGGYVLIGTRRPLDLSAVRWSTPHALADTLSRLAAVSIDCTLLPAAWDVDDEAGLARFDALRADQGIVMPTVNSAALPPSSTNSVQ